ncbi:MAG: hypothetical protein KGZ58_03240 [Ignavibacteriales bacterium]|nr:hypothetical protein [Ignavibacteriales bacterium]
MFKIDFTPDALKDISSLDKTISLRVVEKLDWLIENFDTISPETLTGEFRGKYKLRVGELCIQSSMKKKQLPFMQLNIEAKYIKLENYPLQ